MLPYSVPSTYVFRTCIFSRPVRWRSAAGLQAWFIWGRWKCTTWKCNTWNADTHTFCVTENAGSKIDVVVCSEHIAEYYEVFSC